MTYPCGYDSAGAWNGGAGCAGGLLPGARGLADALTTVYPGSRAEGYNCRPNTANRLQLSVHGTGRAVDLYPTGLPQGDQAAAMLVKMAPAFGIQLIIWNRRDWTCSRGWTSYGGPHPHTDHLHIEQRTAAALATRHRAAWYLDQLDPFPTGALTMAEIDRLLKAHQDTRKFLAGMTARLASDLTKTRADLLRGQARGLRAEWRTRQLLREAGALPDKGDTVSDIEAALNDIAEELRNLADPG